MSPGSDVTPPDSAPVASTAADRLLGHMSHHQDRRLGINAGAERRAPSLRHPLTGCPALLAIGAPTAKVDDGGVGSGCGAASVGLAVVITCSSACGGRTRTVFPEALGEQPVDVAAVAASRVGRFQDRLGLEQLGTCRDVGTRRVLPGRKLGTAIT
jgi:hypothetical protein